MPPPDEIVALPADSHVHSEWSWDARDGSMERTCARAVEIGLPALAFTEHVDFTAWEVVDRHLEANSFLASIAAPDGLLTPPPFDVEGYFESVERCRDLFPGLRIITGVELGEPHLHAEAAGKLLAAGDFERVLGSLHCLPIEDGFAEPTGLYRRRRAADVVRDYLAEVPAVIESSGAFSVLAHIDYAVRSWPAEAGPFDPHAFEDEFRHALRVLAGSGRALEVNTSLPLHPDILAWWRDEGGDAVTFGSDAHSPADLARGFARAAAMVEANGFRAGRHPFDVWGRSR
ncbi:PHP domain-containing protein [Phytomonospora sp. NPDC050363]|uniref:PHP domain-containing protein n=1 Tax=Phytomonospora sp. NPDC050363 TaxID=3155642 RepID=UPI0033C7A9A9